VKDDGHRFQRRHSAQSAISDVHKQLFPSPSPPHQRQRSQDRRDDPLGLTVLHAPDPEQRTVDILFIHGLGGTSLRTWCKNRDLDLLWPQNWLPADADLSSARILTFGYNAHFSAKRQQASLTIGDFANDLLFSMKYGGDGDGDVKMGQVPIIIVAHSLGGLVFKKAFIQGHLNEEYRKIVSNIKAVLFMATPHRGADLAETLNRVLSSSIFGHSPREYIAELAKNSPTIDDLNEAFRHHAAKLHIFSFYETLGTTVGPVTTMILAKQASLLGYQNETSQPLIADHHDVCKFTSQEDPNYKSVRGALRSLVNMLRFSKANDGDSEKDLETIGNWLNVTHPPEEDMAALRSLRKPGTCEDILRTPKFETWLQSQYPHILWVSAAPGSGKSIQCSFVIDYLKERKARCFYWFFRYGDAQKRSLANMLRSISYQMAIEDTIYRRALVGLANSGTQMRKADATTVWRHIFAPKLHLFDQKTYWIIDGLDESESSRSFVDLVSTIGSAPSNIGIIMFSRPLPSIVQSVQRAKKRVELTELSLADNLKDIRLFLDDEMEDFLAADKVFKQHTVDQIVERAHGNFLWASLVTKRVVKCLRPEDVNRVLQDVPDGMDRLYHRMAEAIGSLSLDADKYLCEVLLSWAMYSNRPIAVEELTEPYAAELGTIMNLEHTVSQICGQFVVLNPNNQLSLLHHTAREYLRTTSDLPFSLESSDVNKKLLVTCLTTLCNSSLRTRLRRRKIPSFLPYASVFWVSHLDRCSVRSETVLRSLFRFFNGDFPLTWIQYLAMSNQLSVLVSVASSLNTFVRRRRKADALTPPTLHPLSELAALETWAVDLLKMTAKFGSCLVEDPDSIHKCVPPLSPESSMLHQKYAKKSAAVLSISGLSTSDWDDCLARVSNGSDQALHVAVSAQYLAVASESANGKGTIKLWNSVIFQERPGFHPEEPICSIAFSPSGSLLACYGLDRTYVWSVGDMALVTSLESPHRERALAVQFAPDESYLVVATDLRHVFRLNLDTSPSPWLRYPSPLLEETIIPEGAFINSPSSISFNAECTQVAVAYRGFPLAVWSLDPPEMIARCRRKQKQGYTTSMAWTGVNRVVWHPFDGQVLGIYRDGNIFKWGPIDDSHDEVKQELDATPSEIRCSINGLVFATSDVRGSVKIYDYSQMVLIYKLSSDDIINSIAFSPDGRRFYDLRGSHCNVWEPNCLMRIVDGGPSGDSESMTSSESERGASHVRDSDDSRAMSVLSFSASEAHADSKPAIVDVTTCPDNHLLCAYAKDEGTIEVFDMARNLRHVVAHSPFGMRVDHVALSSIGDYIAYSMHNGRITVKQLDLTSKPGKIKITTRWTEKKPTNRGTISQLIVDHTRERLFVYGSEKIQVLKLEDGSLIVEKPLEQTRSPVKWGASTDDPEILLAFAGSTVSTYRWDDLDLQRVFRIDRSQGTSDLSPATSLTAEVLLPSYHPRAHLLVTSFEEAGQKYLTFLLLDTSILRDGSTLLKESSPSARTSQPKHSPMIRPVQIAPSIARHIEQPVGLLRDGRLVFLDENLWVCTAQVWADNGPGVGVGDGGASVMRHFFIPRDWLNSSGMMLCRIQADGTLLCPSKGEIAIMRSDLGTEW
jgi:WD40 repeat protein